MLIKGMTLREFFERHGIRYTPWAKHFGVPASCIHRHLQGKGNFDPSTAKTIHEATDREVDLITLCPNLADIINDNT